MARGATRCMRMRDWPSPDRAAWEAALKGADWLDDPGAGFHWRPKTRIKYASAYGHWLAWLSDEALLDPSTPPRARVTPERLISYANWVRARVAPVTARIRIEDLKAVLDAIDPGPPIDALSVLLRRLPNTPSRDKRRMLRDPIELIALGLRLMEEAENETERPPRFVATQYRDGLMIAFAAWRPLRASNLAALSLTRHLRRVNGVLRIVIPRDETKSSVAIDQSWPEDLLPPLRRYLDHWRKILLGPYPDPGALWIASRGGGSITPHTLACNFRRHTGNAFEHFLSPHFFRDAAATMMAIRDPEHVRAAAAVLGHASYETTERHYNLATQLTAVGRLHAAIDDLTQSQSDE